MTIPADPLAPCDRHRGTTGWRSDCADCRDATSAEVNRRVIYADEYAEHQAHSANGAIRWYTCPYCDDEADDSDRYLDLQAEPSDTTDEEPLLAFSNAGDYE